MQAGYSSTALMDTSRLVGPAVGKLLSSPGGTPRGTPKRGGATPERTLERTQERTVEADSSEPEPSSRFGSNIRSSTSTSNNLHVPSAVLDPAMLRCAGGRQAAAGGGRAGSPPDAHTLGAGAPQSALQPVAQARNDTRGNLMKKMNPGKTQEPPESPHSQTVSLSGGLESQASGPSRASLCSPLTKETSPMPHSTSAAGSDTSPFGRAANGAIAPRKRGTRNSRYLSEDAAQEPEASSSVPVDSPSSGTRALHSMPLRHDSGAANMSLHPHSEGISERSGSTSMGGSPQMARGARGHAQHSPGAQLSDGGSTAPVSSMFAPGAATKELRKLDVLAEHSVMDGSEMAGSEMAGIGMAAVPHGMHPAIPEERQSGLNTNSSFAMHGTEPTNQLAMMYGSASQFPDGHSRPHGVPQSGYLPDGAESEHVLSTFGNTGVALQAQHAYHSVHDAVPEMSSMGGSSHMTGTDGSALGPSARLPVASRGGQSAGNPSKPLPVAVLQSMSSRGGPSQMDAMGQFSGEPLQDVPGASEDTGERLRTGLWNACICVHRDASWRCFACDMLMASRCRLVPWSRPEDSTVEV